MDVWSSAGFLIGGALGFLSGLNGWMLTITLIECFLLFPLVAFEKAEIGLLSLVAFTALAYFVGGYNVLLVAYHHPWLTLLCILGYFVFGTLWSVFRWHRFGRECRERFNTEQRLFREYLIGSLNAFPSDPKKLFENISLSDGLKDKYLQQLQEGKVPKELIVGL